MAIELNERIEDELTYCPPASDPRCPTCKQKMNLIPGDQWACGFERCPNTDVYEWRKGKLVRVYDDEIDALPFIGARRV